MEYLTVTQYAALTGVTRQCVLSKVARGRLYAVTDGRRWLVPCVRGLVAVRDSRFNSTEFEGIGTTN